MHRARYYKTSKDFYYSNNPSILNNVQNVYPRIDVTESHEHSRDDQVPDPVDQPPVKMNMKWTTIQHSNSKHPDVWGPAFWFTLHNGASVYPVNATPICAERMKSFIIGMPIMIPCEKCQDHATAYIEQNYHRLNKIVNGRQNLFNFFVSFHNYVNERYGKPQMGYEEAYALYTGGVNLTKLSYSESEK
jgi:hypothetical protein